MATLQRKNEITSQVYVFVARLKGNSHDPLGCFEAPLIRPEERSVSRS